MASGPDNPDDDDTPFCDLEVELADGSCAVVKFHTPAVSDWVNRYADEAKILLDEAGDYDPVAISALRIAHAVLIAARRKDQASLEALREWENRTFKYMKEHAHEDYLKAPLPPRPIRSRNDRHDRHLIIAALRERIEQFLRRHDELPPVDVLKNERLDGELTTAMVVVGLHSMVRRVFPGLSGADDAGAQDPLYERIKAQIEASRPLSEIDPEVIILDGLEVLGLPRPTAHNWLRSLK